jgi:hypothetical protein
LYRSVGTSGSYSNTGPLDVISLCGPGDKKVVRGILGFSKILTIRVF